MLDDAERQIVEDVARCGFHSLGVGADDDEPQFRYSIGFWESIASPDLIIFGLDMRLMHNMLWELFRQIKGGKALRDGERYADLIEGFDCVVRPVHGSHMRAYFGFGLWYHRHRGRDPGTLEAYQVFWPGAGQGLFPWERECVQGVRDAQPQLYLPHSTGLA